jgi:hypothetical protein
VRTAVTCLEQINGSTVIISQWAMVLSIRRSLLSTYSTEQCWCQSSWYPDTVTYQCVLK